MLSLFYKPVHHTHLHNLDIELWVARRKLPFFMHADAVLVPVAPDLKMVFGIAKMIRDYGANTIQYEANQAAPLPPGQAYIGAGGRYRFKYTILAVIFDEVKRTSPELILRAVRSAVQQAQRKGVESIIFPDMTENLLAQPNWITPEQRQATAEVTARTLVNAIMVCQGAIKTVKIWVWDPANAPAFQNELKRLESQGWDESTVLTKGTELPMTEKPATPTWLEYGRTGKIRNITVTTATGDFLRLEADAVLRPTSDTLDLDAPASPDTTETLSARLLFLGGQVVTDAARTAKPIPLGGATLTGAGELPHIAHILHLACRPAKGPATAETLWNSVQSAITLADANHLKSLIIPNLGAGKSDYPMEMTAPLVLEAITDYIRQLVKIGKESGIETITLYAADDHEAETWDRALDKYVPSPYAFLLESHEE
jgi:O-acetyl-ADP-ribose deacetylase (regulator of RNase III)